VRAVMDAARSDRAVVTGISDGGPMCALFAASHPERTRALVMYGSCARATANENYPEGLPKEVLDGACRLIESHWGEPLFLEGEAPSRAHDESLRRWWASYLRAAASPQAALALLQMNDEVDVTGVLSSITVPSLILHRVGDRMMPLAGSRALARRIPGARLIELAGEDHLPFIGDHGSIVRAIREFVAELPSGGALERPLATLVALTGTLDGETLGTIRSHLVREHAVEISSSEGDVIVAAFDGAARAIGCATAIVKAAKRPLSAAISLGDPSQEQMVTAASALARQASAREILVAEAAKDLVARAGIALSPARLPHLFAVSG